MRDYPELAGALDLLASGHFSHADAEALRLIADDLRHHDPFLVCADFASYLACQEQVSRAWTDRDGWIRASILNSARSGRFSSDRSIREYSDDIWHHPRTQIALG